MWQAPVTDWTAADHLTYTDINRICGNLNYLAGDTSLPVDLTQNSFLTLEKWREMITKATQLAAAVSYDVQPIGIAVTADHINALELTIAAVKKRFDLIDLNHQHPTYAGVAYAGIDYARG